ncbi:hypothetical protein [Aminobacter sp. MDW-2]|uniref:COG3904 family protein n=1 Tax=Aminobacter sp. MDW-2 TaxID=2666139 RepID=UPI0012B0C7F3|nr:hypothetical protein [Aminobacter sp. MDW-2]MRX32797.1 hypothetical protein [Aminobacter sp. MDW-2]QNH34541.1 hypothetical protein H5P29_00890 [Aminobacter sp. MDW-2]
MKLLVKTTLAAIALATAPAGAMTFEVQRQDGVSWIYATGPVEADDAARFETIAKEHGEGGWLVLDSGGGSLWGSVKLGRAVREHRYTTYLPSSGRCLSSCFFAFIGGADRVIDDGGRLGVHQFYGGTDEAPADKAQANAQTIAGELYAHVTAMGVSTDVMQPALRTPSTSMYEFSRDELVAYGLHIEVDEEAKKAWADVTVPAFLKQHPQYAKGSQLYRALDAEVRRLQAGAKNPYDAAILDQAHNTVESAIATLAVGEPGVARVNQDLAQELRQRLSKPL